MIDGHERQRRERGEREESHRVIRRNELPRNPAADGTLRVQNSSSSAVLRPHARLNFLTSYFLFLPSFLRRASGEPFIPEVSAFEEVNF